MKSFRKITGPSGTIIILIKVIPINIKDIVYSLCFLFVTRRHIEDKPIFMNFKA